MTLDASTFVRDMNSSAIATFEDVAQSSNLFDMNVVLSMANTEYVSQLSTLQRLTDRDSKGSGAYAV